MPKIKYQDCTFGKDRMERVQQANKIIAEYQAQGFELTLRQLYYQFVSRDLIQNNQREYKNLGELVNLGRLCGLIDWNAIVDRTRNLQSLSHWDSPAQIVDICARQYREDLWAEQPNRVEVWIEKDALVGVIEPVCQEHDVPFFSCRGYTSQSELWAAGQRFKRYEDAGQFPVVLHLGDHDPSGKDMTRDITDRLELFVGIPVEVKRLALNMDQIKKYNPPPNPAKLTDSRSTDYIDEFGDESWELDALDPKVIHALIKSEILLLRKENQWNASLEAQNANKAKLQAVSEKWDEIVEQL